MTTPEPKTETVIERVTDTLTIVKPVPTFVTLKSYEFFEFVDTAVVVKDSLVYVHIPIEQKVYEGDTYRAVVSGFKPSLDSIETYKTTEYITNTVIKRERPIVSFGLGVNFGYNPVTKQWDATIGGSVIIPIYSIYPHRP